MGLKIYLIKILSIISITLLTGCLSGTQESSPYVLPTKDSYPLLTSGDNRFVGESQPNKQLQNNACMLLRARPHWKIALREVQKNWGISPWYVLAFLYQESRFNPTALSSSRAYGYAQVKDDSWIWYQTKTGHIYSKRERFDDSVDFIGFYASQNVRRNNVRLNDIKNQYLAYHEGMGGFERSTYIGKPWLLAIADKVVDRSVLYQEQLLNCPIE